MPAEAWHAHRDGARALAWSPAAASWCTARGAGVRRSGLRGHRAVALSARPAVAVARPHERRTGRVGGYLGGRFGGVNTLTGVLCAVAVTLVACGLAGGSLVATTLLLMLCLAALGAGNGALFQLVPLRWPLTTAVGRLDDRRDRRAGRRLSARRHGPRQAVRWYAPAGFVSLAVLAAAALVMRGFMPLRWTRTWAKKQRPRRRRGAAADRPSRRLRQPCLKQQPALHNLSPRRFSFPSQGAVGAFSCAAQCDWASRGSTLVVIIFIAARALSTLARARFFLKIPAETRP